MQAAACWNSDFNFVLSLIKFTQMWAMPAKHAAIASIALAGGPPRAVTEEKWALLIGLPLILTFKLLYPHESDLKWYSRDFLFPHQQQRNWFLPTAAFAFMSCCFHVQSLYYIKIPSICLADKGSCSTCCQVLSLQFETCPFLSLSPFWLLMNKEKRKNCGRIYSLPKFVFSNPSQ